MRSRLETPNAQNAPGGTSALLLEMAGVELEMLQHYTAVAKQRQNALSPVGRLPGELLAMIFAYAQAPESSYRPGIPNGWLPCRVMEVIDQPKGNSVPEEQKVPTKVVRYDLGWISLSHVCSAWRMVRG